jgi:hypothetical protein
VSGRKKFPWLSLCLVVLTYGAFGWAVAQSSLVWREWIVQRAQDLGVSVADESALIIVDVLGAILILSIAIALSTPIALLTVFFGTWYKSETKAWVSILGWAFATVFIIRWIDYFARFLVLLCAALLGRLEFQTAGYSNWQTFVIMTLTCLSGFGIGVLIFMQWGR